jgi:microcompartment protein CcmK/EutM
MASLALPRRDEGIHYTDNRRENQPQRPDAIGEGVGAWLLEKKGTAARRLSEASFVDIVLRPWLAG